jgi:hypothetical protein
MNWAPDNAGGDSFSGQADNPLVDIRSLLASTDIPDFDDTVRMRVGEVIARAIFDPTKQMW